MNFRARFPVALVLACGIAAFAQDPVVIDNLLLKEDGSNVLFTNGDVPPEVAGRVPSIGVTLLVKLNPCTKKGACQYHVKASTTSFVVADHMVATSFHLFEDKGKNQVDPETGKIFVEGNVERAVPTFFFRHFPWFVPRLATRREKVGAYIKLIFGGKMYDGELVNRRPLQGHDIALIAVRDPAETFNLPAIPAAGEVLSPGPRHLFTIGYYGGCTESEEESAHCLTRGVIVSHLFEHYAVQKDLKEYLGSIVSLVAPGFSGSPVLNENGEWVGITEGVEPRRYRAYFVPGSCAQAAIQEEVARQK